MRKIIAIIFTFLSIQLYLGTAYSSQPTTFLGPTVRGSYTDAFTNRSAYSVAGELGVKNYRVSGTLGWKLPIDQRLKVTVEYLSQRINYGFLLGDAKRWVNQGAIGAQYEYLLSDNLLRPQFDFTGYYSYAPSKNISATMGRIAGSKAGGIAPSISIQPWLGAKLGVDLNYDRVSYSTQNPSLKHVNGFGGTGRFDQAVTENLDLDLVVGIRKPYNNYQANLNWTTDNSYGEWLWGLGAEYTAGKNRLPSTYNVTASMNFLLDRKIPEARRCGNLKADYKGEALLPAYDDDFKRWTSYPAVRMPQVLAIPEEVPQGCTLAVPTLLSAIPNQTVTGLPVPASFSIASFFGGQNLVYTMAVVFGFGNSLHNATINSTTGVITVTGPAGPDAEDVIVTATNCAGSVSSSFTITLL